MGPMQFLQGTWDRYKTAAPGHSVPNVYDIADGQFASAFVRATKPQQAAKTCCGPDCCQP